MGVLVAQVKNAERMMTHAVVMNEVIALTFADGCKGIIPFSDIPELNNDPDIKSIELPNPYQVNIRNSMGEEIELPWDFVRHYCDSSYRSKIENVAVAGMQSMGKRIRAIREAAGMTQSQLAAAAGIGRVTEVRIENGEQSPRYETLVAISHVLRRPLAELIGG